MRSPATSRRAQKRLLDNPLRILDSKERELGRGRGGSALGADRCLR